MKIGTYERSFAAFSSRIPYQWAAEESTLPNCADAKGVRCFGGSPEEMREEDSSHPSVDGERNDSVDRVFVRW
jgi:hypothetical protein